MTTAPARPPRLPTRLQRPLFAALLASAALGLLGGCAALDAQQRTWIFQPGDRTWAGGLAAAQGMDEVWIPFTSNETGEAVRLHGLWLAQPQADAPLLLYLHGARWDVRGSAHRMRRMHAMGYAVLAIDYRGFGQSSKALPSESLAHEDALAAWQWLAQRHPGVPRHIFGHSLGGAIAVGLAAEVPDAAGLIVEGSFTSIPAVVRSYRWGWLPLGPLITQRFDAGSRIGQVRAPVLVVHGSADQVISSDLGLALFERASAPKRWLLVEGGSHHDTSSRGQPAYRAAVAALFGLGTTAGALQ